MRHVGIAVASILAGTGCNAILGIDDLSLRDAAVTGEAAVDAPGICYGTLVPGCFPAAPSGALTLAGALDTGTDPRCSMGPTCVIGADSITIDTLTVTGARPLVLVAVTTLTISARLEAGSSANRVGPGASSAICSQPGPPAMLVTGGGGAGGSFGGLGAPGGIGSATGGAGGTPGGIQLASTLRAGCPGGTGAGAGGAGGNGGGALALYAGVKIQIDEDIRVSGSGGLAGVSGNGGGGGGGSGGMLVLESPMIIVANDVFANGGGGGEAATLSPGAPGAESSAFDDDGNGGTGGAGGDGGHGYSLNSPAEAGKTMGQGGGGGGGGGAGLIWVKGALTGTKISPPVIQR